MTPTRFLATKVVRDLLPPVYIEIEIRKLPNAKRKFMLEAASKKG